MEIGTEIRIPTFGLKQLVDITYGCIDEAARKAFINAQRVDLEKKVKAARLAVIPYVATNFTTGFVPIPF